MKEAMSAVVNETKSLLNGDNRLYGTRNSSECSSEECVPSESVSVSESFGQTTRNRSLSSLQATMHLLKGSIGTGILSTSRAIKLAGLLLGSIGILLLGSLAAVAMYVLARCSRVLCKRYQKTALDYGDVAYEASKRFSEKAAKVFRGVVNFFLILTQLGFCSTYVLFISEHLVKILQACNVSLNSLHMSSNNVMTLCLVLPLILTSLVRSLDKLSFLSLAANVVLLFGMCFIWYFTVSHLNLSERRFGGPLKDLPLVAPASGWPLFFGIVVSSFESIGVVLPTENKIKHPQAFRNVFLVSTAITIGINVATATLGYMCFGDKTKAMLTLNLPSSGSGSWINTVVQVFFVFTTYVTFLIEFYVAMTIIEPPVFRWVKKWQPESKLVMISYTIRVGCVILLVAAVLAIPRLTLFIPLAGSIGGATLAFVFPAIIFLLTFTADLIHERRYVTAAVLSSCAILTMVIGLVGSIFGLYFSIKDIVAFYDNGRKVEVL